MKNNLGIISGMYGKVQNISYGKERFTRFFPTQKSIANARVLDITDTNFRVHRLSNYNTNGDFITELMTFDSNAILDLVDQHRRYTTRKENGLIVYE